MLLQPLKNLVGIAVLLAFQLCRHAHAAPSPTKSSPDVIIYEGIYPGWPWVAKSNDGTFHCVFREGTEHDYSPSGRALLCQSRDRGRTWGKPITIADAPEGDDRNVAILPLPDDSLLVVYNTYTKARESLAVSIRSADGGKSWTPPKPIGEPNTRTRSAPLALKGGALLLPFYIAPGSGALAARSEDSGRTWKTVRVPDTEGFVGDEWDALEISPGRILGVIRNSHAGTDGTFWWTESRDDGRTWSVPQRTNLQSRRAPSPPHLCLQNGRPTLIHADRRMVSITAARVRSAGSWAEWDMEHTLPCYLYNADESPILDGSYPASVAITPDERLVVDYEIRSGSRRITGYFVSFPKDW